MNKSNQNSDPIPTRPDPFTADEFVTAITEVQQEVRDYNSSSRSCPDNCPCCTMFRVIDMDGTKVADGMFHNFVKECCRMADPINFMLHGRQPSHEMMVVVCNAIFLGVKLGRAHTGNRELQNLAAEMKQPK